MKQVTASVFSTGKVIVTGAETLREIARLVVVRRRRPVVASRRVTVTKRRSRRPVVVVKRRIAKKTRRVSVRRGPAIKDIKKLVHRLRKSELETRVVQCLMR